MGDIIVKKGDRCYAHMHWDGVFGVSPCRIRKIETVKNNRGEEEVRYYIRYEPPFEGYSQSGYKLGENLFLNPQDAVLKNIEKFKDLLGARIKEFTKEARMYNIDPEPFKQQFIDIIKNAKREE